MRRYRKPKKIKRKKPIFKRPFFKFFVYLLFLSGFVFYFMFLFPYFQITKIEISGGERISVDKIKELIFQKINNKFVFFNSKNIFTFSAKRLEEEILKTEPIISDIKIKRNFPNVLAVDLIERTAVSTFCQNEICFYLDKEGIAFMEDIKEKHPPLIRIENFLRQIKIGDVVIEKYLLKKILDINNNLEKKLNIETKEFVLSNENRKLTVMTNDGFKVIFNLEKDVFEKIYQLDLVLKEKIPSDKRKNLDYIDLRFNKIYFKYK